MQDLRYALRLLARSPGFTAVSVLTLALGIGANTAVFSIIEGALLRPLPYREPQRLVAVWDHSIREGNLSKIFDSYHDFEEWSRQSRTLEDVTAATWAAGLSRTMTGRGPAREVLALPVSESFFPLLGVSPEVGRGFLREDLTRGCQVVLSHQFWSSLGADRAMVGQGLTLDKQSCTVLGVMPPRFAFYPPAANMWMLLTPDFTPPRDRMLVGVFARLKRGVTAAQAESELVAIHDALHRSDGQERNIAPMVYDMQQEFTWMAGRNLRTTLWVLLGAVSLVLMIACFNVANLLLARALVRGRELAIRAAVGCSRARLLRQLLTEGLVMTTLGGALGVVAAVGALRYFRAVNPVDLPVGADISISLPVLLFTAAVAVATALFFGLAPGWRSSRADLNLALKTGTGMPAGSTFGRILVAAEMALSLVLLAGAGLLLESVVRMGSAHLGFEPDGLYATGVALPRERFGDAGRRQRFYDDLQARLATVPGITDAALATSLPPQDGGASSIEIFGAPAAPDSVVHDVAQKSVSPNYFRTLGIALRRGRLFDARDRKDSEAVAVVDESLAQKYFPHADPIGRRIRLEDSRRPQEWMTIVGVVEGQKRTIVYQEMGWIEAHSIFRPLAQDSPQSVYIAVRSAADAIPLGLAIRREVSALDSEIPVRELESIRQRMALFMAYPRFRATVLGGFAAFALLLAVVGLHGVLGQLVAQKRREIGVRMALGAKPWDVVRLVAVHGGAPVVGGLVVGLAASIAVSRFLTAFLYGVRPRDPRTLVAVSVTLLLAAALAIALPARRAVSTNPVDALRQE